MHSLPALNTTGTTDTRGHGTWCLGHAWTRTVTQNGAVPFDAHPEVANHPIPGLLNLKESIRPPLSNLRIYQQRGLICNSRIHQTPALLASSSKPLSASTSEGGHSLPSATYLIQGIGVGHQRTQGQRAKAPARPAVYRIFKCWEASRSRT